MNHLSMGERIRRARKALGLTQQEFAERLQVTQPTVHRWEKGFYEPDEAALERLAALCRRSPAYFRYGETETSPALRPVPVVGLVGAGAQIFPFDDHAKGAGLDTTEPPPGERQTTVALIVRGDSMYPAYQDGDLIYYAGGHGLDEAACLGRECVVKVLEGPTLLKRLTRGARQGTHTLLSYNAPPIENVRLEWASPVRWVKRH